MADDGLFLDNRPLLLDLDGQVESFLNQWLSWEGMVECPPRALVDVRDDPLGDRQHAFPLSMPNYPPAPPLRINQLYWPTGALRHARGYFLCSEQDVVYFRTKAYEKLFTTESGRTARKNVPLQFTARIGGQTFSAAMYLLAPKPLTSITGKRLYLLPLVDERYWWTQTCFRSLPLGYPFNIEDPDTLALTSWFELIQQIDHSLNALTVSSDVLSVGSRTNYFFPDPFELTRYYENPAHLLDVAALSCGLRVVLDPSGHLYLLDRDGSQSRRTANWLRPHGIIAGDRWTSAPMSNRLQVLFQMLVEGAVDCRDKWWRVDMAQKPYATDDDIQLIVDDYCHTWSQVTDPDFAEGVPVNDVIYTTFHAVFDYRRCLNPLNYADIVKLSRAIYKDHYGYQQAEGLDVTFAGIQTWSLSGFDDYALYDFGTEGRPTTSIHAPVGEPDDRKTAPPPTLETQYRRKVTTRVRSMPPEFGIRHQFSQTDKHLRVRESYFRLTEFLDKGGTALADAVWLDGENWIEYGSLELTVKIHDPNQIACGEIGDVIHAEWSCARARWEVDRPHNIDSDSCSGSGSTTTTTPAPCSGYCKHEWSTATLTWTTTFNGCSEPTTTSTSTTTPDPGTTTTTPDPCDCPTTTTTGEPTTTTTPQPCDCLKPTFCGFLDGDCVYTNCGRGANDSMPNCGTPTTTTSSPTTTTTCDCNTTTTSTPTTSPPGCTGGCDWLHLPSGGGTWVQMSNECAPSCPCSPPEGEGSDCEVAHTNCVQTTTTVQPPQFCSGSCEHWWIPATGSWFKTSDSCAGTADCYCFPPSQPGNNCAPVTVPCVDITPTTSPPGGTTTTPAPTGCPHSCYTTAPPATTTTTASPCGECIWRWSTGFDAWTLLVGCGSGCSCTGPVIDGHENCEITKTACSAVTTTTTPAPTTTPEPTTTTSTTSTTPSPCTGQCNYWAQPGETNWTLTDSNCDDGGNPAPCECSHPSVAPGGAPDTYYFATTDCSATPMTTTTTTSTTPPPCGTCLYECDGGSWSLVQDDCTGGCTCSDPLGGCEGVENTVTSCSGGAP